MKRFLALLLILVFALSLCLVSCTDDKGNDNNDQNNNNGNTDEGDDTVRVMSHADFIAAPVDAAVVVEGYVQGAQGWWEKDGKGVISVFLQDNIGGYFAYEMACSEADAAKLVPGTKIRVTGVKGEWSGEIEIMEGTFEFLNENDTYVAAPFNVTSILGTDALATHMNEFVSMKALTVVPKSAENVIYYRYDNSGASGDDIYFDVTDGNDTYTLVVETYLTAADTEVYRAVESLKAGDLIDVEGFLYWYEGAQPWVTSCKTSKVEGAMTYAEYMAAEIDDAVVIDAYVQATQGWWEKDGKGRITAYLADKDGAYLAYEMACSQADAAKLVPGTRIKVTGVKGMWSGEIEIIESTFEFLGNNTYISDTKDITSLLGTEELENYMNARVCAKSLTVVAKDENNVIYYNWDNSGESGSDIYFDVTDGEKTYTFVVETYFTSADSDVYAAVEALQVGDVVDIEAFLYWYEGAQPHVTSVTVVTEE